MRFLCIMEERQIYIVAEVYNIHTSKKEEQHLIPRAQHMLFLQPIRRLSPYVMGGAFLHLELMSKSNDKTFIKKSMLKRN